MSEVTFTRWVNLTQEPVEALYRDLMAMVVRTMAEAGEDPDNKEMFAIRCEQAAYSLNSKARRMKEG